MELICSNSRQINTCNESSHISLWPIERPVCGLQMVWDRSAPSHLATNKPATSIATQFDSFRAMLQVSLCISVSLFFMFSRNSERLGLVLKTIHFGKHPPSRLRITTQPSRHLKSTVQESRHDGPSRSKIKLIIVWTHQAKKKKKRTANSFFFLKAPFRRGVFSKA